MCYKIFFFQFRFTGFSELMVLCPAVNKCKQKPKLYQAACLCLLTA